jgi:nucleoside phosphorylase
VTYARGSRGDVGNDIFLDFLNRDTRQIFAVYKHISPDAHRQMLAEALNICVFIARDACIMPPGFLAEDALVRQVLDIKMAYRDERLIQLPIRETLDEFWAKKEREYSSVRSEYEGLFDQDGQLFVEQNQHLLIDRHFEVGKTLVEKWEKAPDESAYWRTWSSSFPPTVIELFRQVPRQLTDDGRAVTWATISQRLAELTKRYPTYRRLVQHIYFAIYIDSFDLRVVSGLPLIRDNFGLSTGELFYDFDALRILVEPSKLWPTLLTMSADEMIELRKTPGYFGFRRAAYRLCRSCSTKYRLKECMAVSSRELETLLSSTQEAELALSTEPFRPSPSPLGRTVIEAMGQRMLDVANFGTERYDSIRDKGKALAQKATSLRTIQDGRPQGRSSGNAMTATGNRLAVFAALREERDLLIRSWMLELDNGLPPRWVGKLADGTQVLLYSADMMGRVPAAVATARLLGESQSLAGLLILGIAGGFAETKVELGDILVPYAVADLASRKVTSKDDVADSRVRPQPYELDRRLGRYLDTRFGFADWIPKVCYDVEWPAGRRPRINLGGPGGILASVDEVIASNHHRGELLQAWPGLLGVEMEAGGVVAAVREFKNAQLPVFQLRAVSDMADPAKSDDVWRKLGVKTLAHLVNQIEWKNVLDW